MNGFLENLGKRVKETAETATQCIKETAEIAGKKTEEVVEVQKLKSQIRLMERGAERDLQDIGKIVYEQFKKGEAVEPAFVELCETVEKREKAIAEYKKEIERIKGTPFEPEFEDED